MIEVILFAALSLYQPISYLIIKYSSQMQPEMQPRPCQTSRPAIKHHLERLLAQEPNFVCELFDFVAKEIDTKCGLIVRGVLPKVYVPKPKMEQEQGEGKKKKKMTEFMEVEVEEGPIPEPMQVEVPPVRKRKNKQEKEVIQVEDGPVEENQEEKALENEITRISILALNAYEIESSGMASSLQQLVYLKLDDAIRFYVTFLKRIQNKLNCDIQTLLLRDQVDNQLQIQITSVKDIKFSIALSILLKILLPLKIIERQNLKSMMESVNLKRGDIMVAKIDVKKYFNYEVNEDDWVSDLTTKPLCVLQNIHSVDEFQNNYASLFKLESIFNLEESLSNKEFHISTSLLKKSLMNTPFLPNYGKIVKMDHIFSREDLQNKSQLERILLSKTAGQYFNNGAIDQNQCKTEQGEWCLTLLPDANQFWIKRFTDSLPLEVKPLSQSDILSYQNYQTKPTYFFKISTTDYIQVNESSQYMSVFYNFGKSDIEWISYVRKDTEKITIGNWTKEDIGNALKSGIQIYRSIQKPHQIVVVPAGHEYLWRAVGSNENQLNTLLGWSVLLKSQTEIEKFIKISQVKAERSEMDKGIKVAKYRMLLNFISHQYHKIKNRESLTEMINGIMRKLTKEEAAFVELAPTMKKGSVKMEELRIENQFCEYCLTEILNYFAVENGTIHCLDCLKQRLIQINSDIQSEPQRQINLCMLGNHNTIRNMLRLISQTKVFQQDMPLNSEYEQFYCREGYPGSIDATYCAHNPSSPPGKYQTHLFTYTSSSRLQLQYQSSILNCFSIQRMIKVCAWIDYDISRFDRQALKYILARLIKYVQDKEAVAKEISSKISQKNQVLYAMNLLFSA